MDDQLKRAMEERIRISESQAALCGERAKNMNAEMEHSLKRSKFSFWLMGVFLAMVIVSLILRISTNDAAYSFSLGLFSVLSGAQFFLGFSYRKTARSYRESAESFLDSRDLHLEVVDTLKAKL